MDKLISAGKGFLESQGQGQGRLQGQLASPTVPARAQDEAGS